MPPLTIVPVYAALLALMYVALSAVVIRTRRSAGVALGFGGSETLQRRIRAHGNFAEYVPLTLLLLAMAEMGQAKPVSLHVLCVTLVAGRSLHAWGVSQANGRLRIAGMAATLTALSLTAFLLLVG